MDFLSRFFGPPLPALSVQDLSEKLKSGKHLLVVDVRQPEEYREGHIAGAKLIPLGELDRRLNDLPKGKEIVCVCASGNRSREAAKILVGAGYTAINMNGGMSAWQRAGLPVKKGSAAS
ncbi:MAG: rhodanese-like domain-containing protein [Anaerolineales bacterium]